MHYTKDRVMRAGDILKKLLGIVLVGVMALTAGEVVAASLGQPTGKPILIVSGKINVTNKGDAAQFDRAMLESLGTISFETATPWHEGTVTFEGVPLAKVMKTVGATG